MQILKNMYQNTPVQTHFSGVFYAKRIGTASAYAVWRIDGVKNNNENGYIKISTYVEGYIEHILSNYMGEWEWAS